MASFFVRQRLDVRIAYDIFNTRDILRNQCVYCISTTATNATNFDAWSKAFAFSHISLRSATHSLIQSLHKTTDITHFWCRKHAKDLKIRISKSQGFSPDLVDSALLERASRPSSMYLIQLI